jgi:hypothetical protein
MQKRTFLLGASCLCVALLTGCLSLPPDGLPQPKDDAKSMFDPSKATATVSGKISFDGTPPANDKIQMSSDPYCQKHAADYTAAETVRVSNGGLENVIVYVSGGLPAEISYAAPANAVDIVQQNCHYTPHVFTIMTNQTLNVKNGDMTLHNIHVSAEKNHPFNAGQPLKGMVTPAKFALPEVPLPIRCDVHKWMGAIAGVFDHPFETVSKAGGAFELPKLPPGTYEITAWHEKFGRKTATVTVADNDQKEINFSFNGNDKE